MWLGYVTDAYARLRGLRALCATFGVGELLAVNAIAGSFAKLAPVVYIVGTPGRPAQKDRMLLHHTMRLSRIVGRKRRTDCLSSAWERRLRGVWQDTQGGYDCAS